MNPGLSKSKQIRSSKYPILRQQIKASQSPFLRPVTMRASRPFASAPISRSKTDPPRARRWVPTHLFLPYFQRATSLRTLLGVWRATGALANARRAGCSGTGLAGSCRLCRIFSPPRYRRQQLANSWHGCADRLAHWNARWLEAL